MPAVQIIAERQFLARSMRWTTAVLMLLAVTRDNLTSFATFCIHDMALKVRCAVERRRIPGQSRTNGIKPPGDVLHYSGELVAGDDSEIYHQLR